MKKLLLILLSITIGGFVGLQIAHHQTYLIRNAEFVKLNESDSYSFVETVFKIDGKKKTLAIHKTNQERLRAGYKYDLVVERFQIVRPNNEITMVDPGPKVLKEMGE